MQHRPSTPSHPRSTAGGRSRGRRAVGAGVLAASAATLLSAVTLQSTPAAAATAPAGHRSADFLAKAKPTGKMKVAAAVLDLDGSGGKPAVYGENGRYDTASIIKVDILATALLQAQDAGHGLSKDQRKQAGVMIRHSDNDAANALWRQIGQASGLDKANKRLGLTKTKGGEGPTWGLTRTTAADQIRLLRVVFDDRTAAHLGAKGLDKTSRAYIRGLMTQIQDDQAWGVSAAADHSAWALKNGWLQRSGSGLWDVNSVGRITAGKHHYLVSVLSNGSTTMKDGVALVERAAKAAVAEASAR